MARRPLAVAVPNVRGFLTLTLLSLVLTTQFGSHFLEVFLRPIRPSCILGEVC